jgi:hypothetical protein
VVSSGRLKELQISRRGPGISDLLFTDDTLLFLEASEEQADVVEKALRKYEKGTGQLINPGKCTMLFGSDCSQVCKDRVMEVLQVASVASEDKYLGLPMPHGRMNGEKFKTTERLVKRLSTYAERYMSSGAKEILIKSVAQAIPSYVMGGFQTAGGIM